MGAKESESGKHLLGRKDIFRKEQNRSAGNLADRINSWLQDRNNCSKSKGSSLGRKGIGCAETICGNKAVETGG